MDKYLIEQNFSKVFANIDFIQIIFNIVCWDKNYQTS